MTAQRSPSGPARGAVHLQRQKLFSPRVRSIGLVGLTPIVVLTVVAISRLILGSIHQRYSVIAVLVAVAGWLTWVMWPQYRLYRALRRHGRFICLRCFYSLHGLADAGRCPECGEPYSRDELSRLWRHWEISVNKGKPIVKEP